MHWLLPGSVQESFLLQFLLLAVFRQDQRHRAAGNHHHGQRDGDLPEYFGIDALEPQLVQEQQRPQQDASCRDPGRSPHGAPFSRMNTMASRLKNSSMRRISRSIVTTRQPERAASLRKAVRRTGSTFD